MIEAGTIAGDCRATWQCGGISRRPQAGLAVRPWRPESEQGIQFGQTIGKSTGRLAKGLVLTNRGVLAVPVQHDGAADHFVFAGWRLPDVEHVESRAI